MGGNPMICRVIIPIKKLLADEDVTGADNGISSVALGGTARVENSIQEGIFLYEFQKLSSPYDIKMYSFNYFDFNKSLENK